MSNQIKQLRGQVRQVVQEILPQVMNQEHYQQIMRVVDLRLKTLEKQVKDTMHEINERHKDTLSLLLRTVTSPDPTIKETQKDSTKE